MHLKEYNEKIIDKKDDKYILIKLFLMIIMKVDKIGSLIGHKSFSNRILYNKTWNKTRKLFIIGKFKKSLEKKLD